MQSLMLFRDDKSPFTIDSIKSIFESFDALRDLRYNTPIGIPIEADYIDDNDSTIVDLSPELDAISISGSSDTALKAALILQSAIREPLRIIDTDYSFDLVLADYSSVEQLKAAIEHEQWS